MPGLIKQCHVHPDCLEIHKIEVRSQVCVELSADWSHDGNSYCFLHLPTFKSNFVFETILTIRIRRDAFDFRYVCFPTKISFSRKELPTTINFNHATFLDHVSFVDTRFIGEAKFIGTTFKKRASFNKSNFFKDALFSKTVFESEANFSNTDFCAKATFYQGAFHKGANFKASSFKKLAHFDETTFKQNEDRNILDFSESRFENGCNFFSSKIFCEADFSYSIIDDTRDSSKRISTKTSVDKPGANFIDAKFAKVTFNNAVIKRRSDFSSATFKGDCKFQWVKFEGWTEFTNAKFNNCLEEHSTSFENCAFVSSVRFENSKFHQKISFEDARFNAGSDPNTNFKSFANFTNCEFYGPALFNAATFLKKARFWWTKFYHNCYFTDVIFRNTAQFKNAQFGKMIMLPLHHLNLPLLKSPHFSRQRIFIVKQFFPAQTHSMDLGCFLPELHFVRELISATRDLMVILNFPQTNTNK